MKTDLLSTAKISFENATFSVFSSGLEVDLQFHLLWTGFVSPKSFFINMYNVYGFFIAVTQDPRLFESSLDLFLIAKKSHFWSKKNFRALYFVHLQLGSK
jgi:hypothetical protein